MPIIIPLPRQKASVWLFDSCQIHPARQAFVDAQVRLIVQNKARYELVANQLGIPWYIVGLPHYMESNLNFARHLHNGDPLTARTVQVPKGRPRIGNPPFTWEESALDAVQYQMKNLGNWSNWSLAGMLYYLEAYNGFGYRRVDRLIASPYLWSFSNHYVKGKYRADGVYDPNLVSQQAGVALLLKRLFERGHAARPAHFADPAIQPLMGDFRYDPVAATNDGRTIQAFLNQALPNRQPPLVVDGRAGTKTSNAFRQVFGRYLPGDQRWA